MRRLALIALAAAALAAGCGDGEEGRPSPEPATELEVTVWPEGRPGPSASTMVICAEAKRDTKDCRAAGAVDAAALAPVPPDSICTEIFGGPQEAAIEGTLRGEPIDVALSRRNGCEIARYDAAEPLLELARA